MLFGLAHPGRAIGYTSIFLAAGFVWGALAANVPALRDARGIPHLARNRAVALPVFALWVGLSCVLARRYLELSGRGAGEGLRLGILFGVAAFLFDVVVVAWLVGQGRRHFAQPLLWITYALLLLIPWLVGRSMA